LGTVALSGGIATLPLSTLPTGLNPITASYGGDVNYAPSVSKVLSQQVTQAASVTTLSSSANPSNVNQTVTLTATVTGSYGGTPTGSVTFQQGPTVLGTAPLVNAQGTLTQTFPKPGTFNIKAAYSGDSNYKASTSLQLSQIVEAKQALYVGLPVLFVHGICGAAADFQYTENTVQAFLQGNYPELYPDSDQYWVFYNAVHNQVNFQVPNSSTTSTTVPSTARFFAVAFDDPSQNLVQNFDRTNVSNISIYAKADELAHIIWEIKAITGAPRVMIVAHSMGGLVSRAYVERLGTGSSLDSYFQDISTLVTIDTPHGGSTLGELSLLGSGPCFTQETTDKTEMQPSGSNSIIPMLNYITPGAIPLPATLRVYSIVSYWTIKTPLGTIDPMGVNTDNILTGYGINPDEQDLYSNLNNASQNSQSNLFMVKNPFGAKSFFGALFAGCGITDVLHSLNCTGSASQTLGQIEKEIQVPAVMNLNAKVNPSTATVALGGSVQFVATTPSKAAAIWSLLEGTTAGSISATGLYSAPPPGSLTGQFHVVAIDSVKSNDYGIATITVTP
jgi:pimeloyl-ACP methyl ester carboxylesterase